MLSTLWYFCCRLLTFFSKITFWSRSICSLKIGPVGIRVNCMPIIIIIQNSLLGATKLRLPFFLSTFPPLISRWNTDGIVSRNHKYCNEYKHKTGQCKHNDYSTKCNFQMILGYMIKYKVDATMLHKQRRCPLVEP